MPKPELPVLVELGWCIWPALGVILVLIGFRLVYMIRRGRVRAKVDHEVARRMVTVTVPVLTRAEGSITVIGTVRSGTFSTFESSRTVHTRGGDAWIEYRGERLEIASDVRVVHGTSVTTVRARTRVQRMARVQDGDRVIVTGVLSDRSGGVDRLGVRKRLLEPQPGEPSVELVALAAAATPVPLRWATRGVLALVFAGAASAAMFGAGKLALERASSWRASTTPVEGSVGQLDLAAIAAALPGTRSAALAELDRQLASRYEPSTTTRAQRARLAHLRGR